MKTVKAHLVQINDYGFTIDKKGIELKVIRETPTMIITEGLFSFGIVDQITKNRQKNIVRWNKENGRIVGFNHCLSLSSYKLIFDKAE